MRSTSGGAEFSENEPSRPDCSKGWEFLLKACESQQPGDSQVSQPTPQPVVRYSLSDSACEFCPVSSAPAAVPPDVARPAAGWWLFLATFGVCFSCVRAPEQVETYVALDRRSLSGVRPGDADRNDDTTERSTGPRPSLGVQAQQTASRCPITPSDNSSPRPDRAVCSRLLQFPTTGGPNLNQVL